MTRPAPVTVRRAGALVGMQGALVSLGAVAFLIRALTGSDRHIVNGFGNAAWFGLFGAALLAAGWALWTGRRWGRGIAVFAQLLLLPVSWYVGPGSHRWLYGIPIALVALAVLGLLFAPATLQWWADQDSGPASTARPGPDTR